MKDTKHPYTISENDIIAYFDGEATQDQVIKVRAWLRTAEGQDYVSDMMDEDIERVKTGETVFEIPSKIPYLRMLREMNRKLLKRRRLLTLGKVAAVIIPLFIINIITISKISGPGDRNITYSTISVPAGEQLRIILPDGSNVMLNSGSQLEYPSQFARKSRTVKMSGEAFFEVAKDAKRPFFVETGEVSVNVLGTKFNVNTVDKADMTAVYLKEGSVKLHEKVSGNDMKYTMRPGQLALVQKSTGMCFMDTTPDHGDIEGWIHKRYYFKDAPLADLIRHLERTYGVIFSVKDHRLYEYTYTMSFSNESIDDILYQMERITPVRCVNSNGNITINPR